MRYKKKTEFVDVVRWWWHDGGNLKDIVKPFDELSVSSKTKCEYCTDSMDQHGWIETSEGGKRVCSEDYIVTKKDGTVDILKEKEFEAIYEEEESKRAKSTFVSLGKRMIKVNGEEEEAEVVVGMVYRASIAPYTKRASVVEAFSEADVIEDLEEYITDLRDPYDWY